MLNSEKTREPVTAEAVATKMQRLDVVGFSSMHPVSLEAQMRCLEEIERIVDARRETVQTNLVTA